MQIAYLNQVTRYQATGLVWKNEYLGVAIEESRKCEITYFSFEFVKIFVFFISSHPFLLFSFYSNLLFLISNKIEPFWVKLKLCCKPRIWFFQTLIVKSLDYVHLYIFTSQVVDLVLIFAWL